MYPASKFITGKFDCAIRPKKDHLIAQMPFSALNKEGPAGPMGVKMEDPMTTILVQIARTVWTLRFTLFSHNCDHIQTFIGGKQS